MIMTLYLKIELPFKEFSDFRKDDPEYYNIITLLYGNLARCPAWHTQPSPKSVLNALIFKPDQNGRLITTISQMVPSIKIELSMSETADLNEERINFSKIIKSLHDEINPTDED